MLYCCTMLLNFWLICLIFLVVNLYIVLVYWCTVYAKSDINHACVMFCPCPTPIFTMYVSEIIKRPHFKLCYPKWKWVESDRHFVFYWYIWNTVQNRMVISINHGQTIKITESLLNSWCLLLFAIYMSINYEIWNGKEWTGTDY